MVKIKFIGKKPTLQAMKEMRNLMASIRRHGNNYTQNRYFVYEGSVLKAGQSSKTSALNYMNENRTLFSILD